VELHGKCWQVNFADDFPEILFARLVEGPQLVIDCCFQAREVNVLFKHLWVVVMGYQSKEPGSCTMLQPRNLLKESELVSDECVALDQYVNLEIKRPRAPLWQIGLKHDPAIFVRNEVSPQKSNQIIASHRHSIVACRISGNIDGKILQTLNEGFIFEAPREIFVPARVD
jgi:hypothetical protein